MWLRFDDNGGISASSTISCCSSSTGRSRFCSGNSLKFAKSRGRRSRRRSKSQCGPFCNPNPQRRLLINIIIIIISRIVIVFNPILLLQSHSNLHDTPSDRRNHRLSVGSALHLLETSAVLDISTIVIQFIIDVIVVFNI